MSSHSAAGRRLANLLCLVLLLPLGVWAACMEDTPPLPDDPDTSQIPPADGEPPTGDETPDDEPPLDCVPACGFGQVCHEGSCVPATDPAVQLGYTDESLDDYIAKPDGATMPLYTFGQGGGHMFVTIRVAGLAVPADGALDVGYEITRPADNTMLSSFSQLTQFDSLGGGVFEASRRVIFLNDFPELLHQDTIHCMFVVTSPMDAAQTVTVEQTLILEFIP